jgi:hypothetical protein
VTVPLFGEARDRHHEEKAASFLGELLTRRG